MERAEYNVPFEQRYGVKNTSNVVTKRLRYEGFIVSNHDQTEFDATMPKLIANGEIKIKEHVSKGIDNGEVRAPQGARSSLLSHALTIALCLAGLPRHARGSQLW